jgi:hypothetical protein
MNSIALSLAHIWLLAHLSSPVPAADASGPSGGRLATSVVTVGPASSTPQGATAQQPAEADGEPVAFVGGEAIYERDFLAQIRPQTYNIRLQEYQLKLRALTDLIDKRLLKEEAAARGVTEQELVDREILAFVPEPDEQEVEHRFAQRMFNPAQQGALSKDDIRDEIRREQMGKRREAYFQALRTRAGVRIHLPRPRIQVGFDAARVRGNPKGAVAIVEFSDFECPYCAQANATIRNLLSKYEGRVFLAFRDLPLLEAGSSEAGSADAARCAQEQGKFWEYHDVLFDGDQRGVAAFREYAELVGMELEPFDECLASGRHVNAIKADFAEGISLGIRGTPYFFINGIPLDGARSQAEFEQIINEELALLK